MSASTEAAMPDLLSLDEDFSVFVAAIRDDRPLWFCFFTSGFLHVWRKFAQFATKDINLVLLVSGLTEPERGYLHTRRMHPAFEIDELVDSKAVYELLARTMDQPFGWVDVDCYVLDPTLFRDCSDLLGDNLATGPFTYGPVPVLAAPMMFYNAPRFAEVHALAGEVSPSSYAHVSTTAGRDLPGFSCRLLTPRQENLLSTMVAFEAPMRPFPQGGVIDIYADGTEARSHERSLHAARGAVVDHVIYDGWVVLQLLARAGGIPTAHVRNHAGSKIASPEVVHLGGISYWERLAAQGGAVPSRLQLPTSAYLDGLLVEDFAADGDAPDQYLERRDQLRAFFGRQELTRDYLRNTLAECLAAVNVDPSLFVDVPRS